MGTSMFGLLVGVATLTLCSALNSYIVTMPETIRPNLDTRVYVHILKAEGPVDVTVTLQRSDDNNSTVAQSSKTILPPNDPDKNGVSTLIDIRVPSHLMAGSYAMKVEGTGGLTFANWTELKFDKKSSSILVQTDRAMYKPGQTVRFRIFGMLPDLTLLDKPIDVSIFDPKKNKIQQWKGLRDPSGVITESMVMSDHPVLGDWMIKVNQGVGSREKTFTVAEYVLPKFEVKVILPPFGVTKDESFTVKISAMYTFGKPVRGSGVFRLKRKYTSWWLQRSKDYVESVERHFKINGDYETKISLNDIRKIDSSLAWTEFVVQANVTEGITGLRMNDSEEIMFYNSPDKIKFAESLPSTFKPGLKYTAIVRVTQKDDSPIPNTLARVNVSVNYQLPLPTETTTPAPTTTPTPPPPPPPTLPIDIDINGTDSLNSTFPSGLELMNDTLVPRIMEVWPPFERHIYPRFKTVHEEPRYFDVPADGLIHFDIMVPENATSASIIAEYKEEKDYKDLSLSESPSKSYVQVSLLTEKLKPGTNAMFEMKATENVPEVRYQILSKGMVLEAGTFDMRQQTEGVFPLVITADMAPKARMIVQYVRDDGEIVADGITFKVDGVFKNPVAINFDRNSAKPKESVRVDLEATPNSQVYILAVDKSVLLLKSGNDISEDEVTEELQSYDNAGGGSFPWFGMWRWPVSSGGQDASDVFENNGIKVLTDALLYKKPNQWDGAYDNMPMMAFGAMAVMDSPVDMEPQMAPAVRNSAVKPKESKLAKPARVRRKFPETWLWENVQLGQTGQTELTATVPDTITSWVATAFAVNKDTGLGLSPSPSNLEVFLPFFIRMNLPYSVVRGELLVLQVDVFNYQRPAWTLVVMENNPDINNVISTQGGWTDYSTRVGRWMWVESGKVASAFFPIIPRKVGELKIKINAFGTKFSDSVERTLRVEPEGTPEENNNPVLIDLSTSSTFKTRFPIDFPPNAVDGSRRVRAAVIGDVMGPSINGIEKLLKMPYGCGEQNMLNFAPNIYIRRYLTITNKLTPAIDAKSKKYMVKGYQREMTYQHKDGSFSAFGESDKSGTTWLTAFVVKSFAEASDMITIDNEAVVKAVGWLVDQQNPNGTFNEPGKVLHKAMQGGSASGESSLTAFVLIAMTEAGVFPGVNETTAKSRALAQRFLEDEVDAMALTPLKVDVYEMAIIGHALSLAGSAKAEKIMVPIVMNAVQEEGTMHWTRPEEEPQLVYGGWRPPHIQSNGVDIELTSYIMMVYTKAADTDSAILILKWLSAQRNSDGGFSSTQDTIIALQALADLAALIYKPNFNMRVQLRNSENLDLIHEFQVSQNNALMFQTVDIPENIRLVEIVAEGFGMGVVEVATYFNVMDDLKVKSFDVNVTLKEESMTGFLIQVCGRWMRKGASGMSIIEIGYPSGMAPDVDSLNTDRAPDYKRLEQAARGLVLYFDQFDAEPQCVSIYMMRVDMVAEQKPAPIRIYDYYDTSKQSTTFYASQVLAESGVCDVCKNCFCKRKGSP
ncbi:CD109 antigen-like isoform X1 [Mizuhopecten yessoensis]|uniref:CD109 antigen-like isoform X1 n=1 Tax=Mizuhopecten yessoensis TaxID=6573 RepID=UPI000B45E0EA|nr:CD109 antigen-like isoform X1 [Mizuhopecten yessoensis]